MTCGIDPARDGGCWDQTCWDHNPESAAYLDDLAREELARDEERARWDAHFSETGGEG